MQNREDPGILKRHPTNDQMARLKFKMSPLLYHADSTRNFILAHFCSKTILWIKIVVYVGTRIVRELPALVAKRDNMVKDELEPEEKVKWNYLT